MCRNRAGLKETGKRLHIRTSLTVIPAPARVGASKTSAKVIEPASKRPVRAQKMYTKWETNRTSRNRADLKETGKSLSSHHY